MCFLNHVGKERSDRSIWTIYRWKMPFAEEQRYAILHDNTAQRITNTGTTASQRDVFASSPSFLVKLVWQHIVNAALYDAFQYVQSFDARRILRIARNQITNCLKHLDMTP